MEVLSPVGERQDVKVKEKLASRPEDLLDKVVGIIDDGACRDYFKRIEELLRERCHPARIVHKLRPHLSQPSPVHMLDEIVKECDVAIVGVGV
jgi:hypothetical protein